jgi:integrase
MPASSLGGESPPRPPRPRYDGVRHGIEPRNLNRHWYGLRTRARLPSVRLHVLRHTCVTLLLDAGVPPHIVQAIAGHSGIQVTMSIYAHAAQEEQRKALRSLGERLA